MKRRDFNFEEHQLLAAHLIRILEEIHAISAICAEPGEIINPKNWTAPRTTIGKVMRLGAAATVLQAHLERLLASGDHNDLRSWPLYYPCTSAAANVFYVPW